MSHELTPDDFRLASQALSDAADARARAAESAAGELDDAKVKDRRTPSVKIADFLREANRLRRVSGWLEDSAALIERPVTATSMTVSTSGHPVEERRLQVVPPAEVEEPTDGDSGGPPPFMLPEEDVNKVLAEESELDPESADDPDEEEV